MSAAAAAAASAAIEAEPTGFVATIALFRSFEERLSATDPRFKIALDIRRDLERRAAEALL